MTITLDLSEEVAEQLAADATRNGMTIDEYLIRTALERGDQKVRYIGAPSFDPYLAAAGERVREACEELVRLGITDEHGNRIRTDLPEDMKEGVDRDFGG
ncbi:MAG: hypothetical protein FJW32_17270 [Acidobacteria bacterium]|nr:hypothetical protein [Acidobacteriota bacterium]